MPFANGWCVNIQSLHGWIEGRPAKSERRQFVGVGESEAVARLREWQQASGRLPTAVEARPPSLPQYRTILKALGAKSWPVAMSHVAWLLGIEDPNYSPKPMEKAA